MAATLEPTLQKLRGFVREHATNRAGIYRMLGKGGVVIYVGKSKRIRTRLMSYFRAKSRQKAWRIVRDAEAIEWEYTPSEFASLVRELELIKRHRPPYNVQRKRDGIYCFLKIVPGPAPRFKVVRRIRDDNGRYYGPFMGGQRIVDAVKELNDILGLRDCRPGTPIRFADQSDLFGVDPSPLCARYELQRCCAPCAALCSAAEYRSRWQTATAFLDGENDEPMELLRNRLRASIERMNYEHAALVQMRLDRLGMLRSEFLRLRESMRTLSFLYSVEGYDGEHLVYVIRAGSIRERFPAPRTDRERKALLRAARKHFDRPETVAEITTPRRVEELLLVSHWFRNRQEELAHTLPQDRWNELPLAEELDARAGMA